MAQVLKETLHQLALQVGLAPTWQDVYGVTHEVSEESLRRLLFSLGFPCATQQDALDSHQLILSKKAQECALTAGRLWVLDVGTPLDIPWQGSLSYRLQLESGATINAAATRQDAATIRIAPITEPGYHALHIGDRCLQLAVCPRQCPGLKSSQAKVKRNPWGIAVQVYSLRQPTPGAWGQAGDFSLLTDFATHAAKAGADALAISPVHALFSGAPERYSPYSPSSRLFLNVAFAAPELVFGKETFEQLIRIAQQQGGEGSPTQHEAVRRQGPLNTQANIDWLAVVPARLALLRTLFEGFNIGATEHSRADFKQYCIEGGEALESHARYEVLYADYRQRLGPESGWADWPADLHDPCGPAVNSYAREHRTEVDFHRFLQWLADRSLNRVQEQAISQGMSIGLITDLAIGTDPRGSHAWSRQNEILRDVSVGAPPDLFQPLGQNWGITAFSPHALRSNGYAGFIETLRANLRHAGGIRIDHVMGLSRMWLVSHGAPAHEGAYLSYPMDDMLRLLALETWRHKAIVIGENLGTVAPAFNENLQGKGVFGTSVLWFQQDNTWPDWTMATTTTHDLPTIEGWWSARDIAWRERLAQLTPDQAQAQRAARSAEKTALMQRIPDTGLPPAPLEQTNDLNGGAPRQAILKYVASTQSPLVVIPIEDILGLVEQVNLPGGAACASVNGQGGASVAAHPSWVQSLPLSVQAMFDDAQVEQSLDSIRQGRGS